ncbi:MAG: hypothetical protein ACK4NY_09825 [Spirosomataceae bacterium]
MSGTTKIGTVINERIKVLVNRDIPSVPAGRQQVVTFSITSAALN